MIGELKTIVLDARDIAGLSAFYTSLAGWTQHYADDEWITITIARVTGLRTARVMQPADS